MQVLNIFTPSAIDTADSFGILASQTSRYIQRAGYHVNLLSIGPRQAGPAHDPELAAIVNQPIRAAFGGVVMGYPTVYQQYNPISQFGPRIGVAMWESTKPPPRWTEEMNRCSAIVTPCDFCRDVFLEAGVMVPIHVVGLGLNPLYQPAERDPNRPLTFLAFIDRGLRKGGIEAMKAFQAAFGDDMNYRLILKGRTSKVNATILNPNIELIQRDMTDEELYQLYLSADVMIFSTKGEGWGWPCREFAATGGTSLATNFAGTADHINQWGIPIDYKLVRADWAGHGLFSKMDLGQWAEVNFADLVDKIEGIADNRLFYQQRAARQAPGVQKLYSWETFAQKVLNIWEGVQ
jgi:glycosyltransferase involved in cell wall biosynthesis